MWIQETRVIISRDNSDLIIFTSNSRPFIQPNQLLTIDSTAIFGILKTTQMLMLPSKHNKLLSLPISEHLSSSWSLRISTRLWLIWFKYVPIWLVNITTLLFPLTNQSVQTVDFQYWSSIMMLKPNFGKLKPCYTTSLGPSQKPIFTAHHQFKKLKLISGSPGARDFGSNKCTTNWCQFWAMDHQMSKDIMMESRNARNLPRFSTTISKDVNGSLVIAWPLLIFILDHHSSLPSRPCSTMDSEKHIAIFLNGSVVSFHIQLSLKDMVKLLCVMLP